MKEYLIIAAVVVGLLALPFFGAYYNGWLSPLQEQVRRQVFEQTESYVKGNMQRLSSLLVDYAAADVDGKGAIAAVVRHEFSAVDTADYPTHLKVFLDKVMNP